MDNREKELMVKRIRLRAVILKSLVLEFEKDTGIDMLPEMVNFFNGSIDVFEEEENESKSIG